jgi:glucose/arabinose dehydrogenase/PKD repeat protein
MRHIGGFARARGLIITTALVLVAAFITQTGPGSARASTLPTGFRDSVVLNGLTNPTVVQFAADGRIFVGQKNGVIKVFQNLSDTNPVTFADLSSKVDDYWDRGLLGMALAPSFPTDPYVYVLYAYDAAIGGTAPKWNDGCPTPPGPTTDGCLVSARVSRLQANGNVSTGTEQVLINDWCQQFPSHSVGTLLFGQDGKLYVGGGDGASFNNVDYGQYGNTYAGDSANPCGDPPSPAGTALAAPAAQGGALRSQSVRRATGPATLDGAILRIDPATGAGLPDNPFGSSTDPNARRIVAYGLRNPFRFTQRPGTDELWIGDVGWNTWEEIDRVVAPASATASNFGWPCYEGGAPEGSYQAANLNLCVSLYSTPGSVNAPYYTYKHSDCVVNYTGCHTATGSSITGIAFYKGGTYPAAYNGAVFFGDHSRNEIWAMLPGSNGLPDTGRLQSFVGVDATGGAAGNPVDLKIGPGGDLFYVDMDGGKVHRITYTAANQPPTAVLNASPTNGAPPLTVNFNSTGSSDPEGKPLTYSWDLDGDGTFGDATTATASYTYAASGLYHPSLRVTDDKGATDTDSKTITVGNTAPSAVIDTPSSSLTWKVGDMINFSGHATDTQDGALPASALSWTSIMHHCTTPSSCHTHTIEAIDGVSAGSFAAPDHAYPSWLELRLTATDSGGLTSTKSIQLNPKTAVLTFKTNPSGLTLAVNAAQHTTPFSATVIVGSANSVGAPSPEASNYFRSWSDGGAQSHTVTAPAADMTDTAGYVVFQSPSTQPYLYLTNSATASTVDVAQSFGRKGDRPLTCDWDGNGTDTGAVYRAGAYYIRNSLAPGAPVTKVGIGRLGDLPVCGDWNGDGVDSVGVYRPSTTRFYLAASNAAGAARTTVQLGAPGDLPIAGDWNHDGADTVGVYRPSTSTFYLINANVSTATRHHYQHGLVGDRPLTGDWDGDGADSIGLFRSSNRTFYLMNQPSEPAFSRLVYGASGDYPLGGDWNRDGTDTIGVGGHYLDGK